MQVEIEHQREVVGELDVRQPEPVHLDFGAVQDKVEVPARIVAGIRRLHLPVGVLQTAGRHEQLDLVLAHEGVEVARQNVGAPGLLHQAVEVENLLLPRLVAEREVDEKKSDLFELQLDHQLFHAALEVVKLFLLDGVLGKEGVALLVVDGDVPPARGGAVLAAVAVEVAKLFGHLFGLAFAPEAVGAVVHLDQANDIGVERTDELNDLIKVVAGAPEHSKQGEALLIAVGAVANVVKQKSHGGTLSPSRGKATLPLTLPLLFSRSRALIATPCSVSPPISAVSAGSASAFVEALRSEESGVHPLLPWS